ncbi:MAG: 50S ribosomal protein L11 methyltransferase [Ignavibacteria bacterium]|nr:50S ribosomal protein L11 methyltransferase [Ignavibacteria bacterium]MBT8383351.1 50S ribosomal protein L11 methyltransferase [Ignavibacteria bacterium]MBT8390318.1 50S ribosomal protein L11 methyltransferase [Ignavibacteria bacterium]NNJ53352.1 50S ribosomal protein L11 methyltransferase [Ignavibacteriaceae bacterium]NNL22468.1 50S ribosomal protein L11 methyltransferase [Ignavibacteriaceae bacterium]
MKKYITFQIYFHPFIPELITGVLWEFNLLGIIEEDDHIKIFLPDGSHLDESKIKTELEKLRKENLIKSFSVKEEILKDKNWNELWEMGREVIRVSKKTVIKPSFKHYVGKEGETVITVDPKMSFGTGEHQTTKLVLRLLEKHVKPKMKVLDVGSGTGILSIAAIKLGAYSATAIDSDEVCYENCKENCELNGVSSRVKILTGEIQNIHANDFDLILANIQKNILLSICYDLQTRVKRYKKIILSGLLENDYNETVTCYTQTGYKLIEKEAMDEWIALVFQLSNL